MSSVITLVGYVLGWLAFTVPATRFIAAEHAYCHREPQSGAAYKWGHGNCLYYDKPGCWRADGDVTPTIAGQASLLGLIWPLLILPALAYHLAKRKPTAIANQRRIDELERELGIGESA